MVLHRYCTSPVGQNHHAEAAAGHNLGRFERHNLVGLDILQIIDLGIGPDQSLAGQDKTPLEAADHKACSHLAVEQGAQEYCLVAVDIVPVVHELDIDDHIRELDVVCHMMFVGQMVPAGVRDCRKYLIVHR